MCICGFVIFSENKIYLIMAGIKLQFLWCTTCRPLREPTAPTVPTVPTAPTVLTKLPGLVYTKWIMFEVSEKWKITKKLGWDYRSEV
jgi:hypothetical protein